MKDKNKRWVLTSLAVAVLFGIGAVRFYARGDMVGTAIYGVTGIIFILIAYGHTRGA